MILLVILPRKHFHKQEIVRSRSFGKVQVDLAPWVGLDPLEHMDPWGHRDRLERMGFAGLAGAQIS